VVTLSAKIRKKAAELGIDKIGFARADALSDDGARFFEWLGRGFHGEMAWLAREPEKRTDPRLIFPDAKSVISVAIARSNDATGAGEAVPQALTSGFQAAFWVGAGVAAVGVLASLILVRKEELASVPAFESDVAALPEAA